MLEKDFEWLVQNRTKISGFRRYLEQVESELPIHLGNVIDTAATKTTSEFDAGFRVTKHNKGINAGAYWFLPESANETLGRGIWIELWMPRKHVEWLFEAESEEPPSLGLYVKAASKKKSAEFGRVAEAALDRPPKHIRKLGEFDDDNLYCVVLWDKEDLIDCLASIRNPSERLEETIRSFTRYAMPALRKLHKFKF